MSLERVAEWGWNTQAGRGELAPDLAKGLTNQGTALWSLGRPDEALAGYAEAIGIWRLRVAAGRGELAPDLAKGLMGQGVALSSLGRLHEALTCYAEAIGIYRPLAAAGRGELARDLAMVLMNRGNALGDLGRLDEALACYGEGIALREASITKGQMFLAPNLLKGLRIRLGLLLQQHEWEAAAADVVSALNVVGAYLQAGLPAEAIATEVRSLIEAIRARSPEEKTALWATLGEWAETVREIVEGGKET